VTAGPSKEFDDAADKAENVRLTGDAKIGHNDAAVAMTEAVKGSISELGLDDHLGKTVWEGTVVDSAGTKHDIRLDAASGAVVSNVVDR
jgi:uncharacterized membrane protein YkoI